MPIKHALISVSDKSGLADLAAALKTVGATIYSTGGSAALLRDAGHEVTDVGDLTGYDEMLDGRVKTLHPNIHAAILADMQNARHIAELKQQDLPKMDLVVVNFYPFEQAVASGAPPRDIIENIDIGGPTMARAAAKNYANTLVLTDPADYPIFIGHLSKQSFPLHYRRQLARKAFVGITHMDAAIANYFLADSGDGSDNNDGNGGSGGGSLYPEQQFLHLKKVADLKYGENPHQPAACYRAAAHSGGYTKLQGGDLSYNNLLDAHAAVNALAAFSADGAPPAAVIVKHTTPCGIAVRPTLKSAFASAERGDPTAAFGGIVALNRPVDEDTARLIQQGFYEVVIAPQFSAAAKTLFAEKQRLRILITPPPAAQTQITSAGHLYLLQTPDRVADDIAATVVSQRAPSKQEMQDLLFAWRGVAAVKSNAILLARNQTAIGIGAGQMSRVDAARLACEKAKRAKHKIAGSAAASDGFFPFADNVETLADAGVKAIIQPGGSKNDQEVIAAADNANIAMVFTGTRHFRH